jgi:hypothetical protein
LWSLAGSALRTVRPARGRSTLPIDHFASIAQAAGLTSTSAPLPRPAHPRMKPPIRRRSRFGAPAETIEALGPADPMDAIWMGHPPARIDLMKGVPGGDFDAAWARRNRVPCGGTTVVVVSRADLVVLKRASVRPLDLIDADALESDGD